MRFGVVLRHTGAFDDAISYFKQLAHHSEITGDQETYAIAFHNIAMCHMGKHESLEAVSSLIKQKEISDMFKLEDLQADALQELGMILLQEGQQWESEECYASACKHINTLSMCLYNYVHKYKITNSKSKCIFLDESFERLEKKIKPPHSHCNNNLAMWGISAGQKLWSRFTGLIRGDQYDDICGLMEWKNRRATLPGVARPNYDTQYIEDVYKEFNPEAYEDEDTTGGFVTASEEDGSRGSGSSPGSADKKIRRSVVFQDNLQMMDEEGESDIVPIHIHNDPDDYEFLSDYNSGGEDRRISQNQEALYRKISAKRSSSMNRSLSIAMEERKSLSFPGV
jgi:tetratricopeptide (TPR) repeat protein